jgi:serine/threonine-protein kinase
MSDDHLLNNRYLLQDALGKGGMAVVYRATDLMLERTVALKVLRHNFSDDPTFRERFRQEAKAAANLAHPNIVTVHDFGYDENRLFIIMEYVPGADLKTAILQRGRYPIQEALPLLVQMCAGIGYAHRAGLVHCDVKPHNVIITPDQRVKVTDFGIARALASIQPDERADVVWGSPQYFSPEQAGGHPPSPASDVYGIGVMMYEMLTGQLPFISASSRELARMHRDVRPIPPSALNPDIPVALEQILLKVLSKEPSARYRTADQLGRILLTFSRTTDETAEPVQRTPAAPNPVATGPIPAAPRPPTQPRPGSTPVAQPVLAGPPLPETADPMRFDWIAVLLGLVAVLAAGGLIPFWIWVIFSLNPP